MVSHQVLPFIPDTVSLADVMPWVGGCVAWAGQEARQLAVVKALRR